MSGVEEREHIEEPGRPVESVDWWSVEYDALDEQLVCPICRTALVDPYCTDCGHTFCKECILATNRLAAEELRPARCPIDRKPVLEEPQPAPLIVRSMLDCLIVQCPFAGRGCVFRGERWLLDAHVALDCAYVRVACHPPCEQRIERRLFDAHECRCASVRGCDTAVAVSARPDTEAADGADGAAYGAADGAPRRAAGGAAGGSVANGANGATEGAAEVAATAAEATAEAAANAWRCPGHEFGCTWTPPGSDESTEAEDHAARCPLALVAPALRSQSAKIEAVQLENRALRRQLEAAARHAQRSASDLDTQILSEYERLWNEIQAATATRTSQQQLLVQLSMENVRMTEDVSFLRSTVDSLRRQMQLMSLSHRRMSLYSSLSVAGSSLADGDDAVDDTGRQRRGGQKL